MRVLPGSHLRLHRRDRQGLRRRQPQRHAGRRGDGPAGRPAGDRARAGRDHGPVRPLPHHLRDHAARGPRQQLRPQARRPDAAQRLPDVDAAGAGAARDPRQGAALQLSRASIHRVVGLDMADAVFEPGSTEMRPQWKPRIAPAARGAREVSRDPPPVVRRRRRGRGARRTSAWTRSRRRSRKRGRRSTAATRSRSSRRCSGIAAPRRISQPCAAGRAGERDAEA